MSPLIRVTILDDPKAEKCEGLCGLDFSSSETIKQVTDSLNRIFGNELKLEFLDLSKTATHRLYPEIIEKVRTSNLSLPILLINGKLRISGGFDIHLLKNTIQIDLDLLNEDV